MSRFISIPIASESGFITIVNSGFIERVDYKYSTLQCNIFLKSGAEVELIFESEEELGNFIEKNFILFNS